MLLTIDALTLLAVCRQTRGDSVNAMIALGQALAVAEPENRVHAFLDLGVPMAKLLARFCEDHPDHGFARKLLAAFPTQDNPRTAVELALSDRELEVLRLIAAGKSNEEIARTLTLALSTVKWYVNVLYSKLQVKTRSQAIARTHELKLLAH
jgi:LuxR family maltose regulon positive regulatory protein